MRAGPAAAATFAVVGALLAPAATGCGAFLSLEAQAPDACITVTDLKVLGKDQLTVPYTLPNAPITVRQTFSVPVDETDLPLEGAVVLFTAFELVPQGSEDFDFIESAGLSALSAGLARPLAEYQRTAPDAAAITMSPSPPPDVAPYLENGKLVLEWAFTGVPPDETFLADATVCLDITVPLDHSDLK